jgi:hypothetical protein
MGTWSIGAGQPDQDNRRNSIPSRTGQRRRKPLIGQSSGTIGSTGSELDERLALITIADIVHGGLTTSFAIGVVVGLTTQEIELAMAGKLVPTAAQGEALNRLLKNYELAIKLVNAATMVRRLGE